MLTATSLACAVVLSATGSAGAATYAPKGKAIFHGVSDTGDVADYRAFNRQVRAHTPLLQNFFHWGVPLTTGALDRWDATDTRGVLSLSTAPGGQPEMITPRQIATGRDDHYMVRLNQSIAKSKQVVYIRPFAEMNLHINPYSAFNADGSPRAGHSTGAFKRAWKRLVLIVRGGKRKAINRKLMKLGMPRIYRARNEADPVYREMGLKRTLKNPKVAFMWMPLTRGSPNVRGNAPKNYYPGRRFVDWVGTDTYSKFANSTLWRNLNAFYRRYRRFPFAIGEYGPWDNDVGGAFTRRIFRWAQRRSRAKALLYFRSNDTANEFNLQYYPGAKRELRRILNRKRYRSHAPGTRDHDGGPDSGGTPG